MQSIDALLLPRWLIPVQPEGLVLEDHALAMHEGRIVDVLPRSAALSRYRAGRTHELDRHALIPGLVNAHTHAAMSLLRGLADDLPLMEWLSGHIWPAEGRWVGERFVRDGTQLAMAEMLRGGTTCFADMYFFPDVAARAVQASGMRASIGLIVIDFPSAWASDADDYLAKALALHETLRHDPRISTALAPHAPYTVSEDTLCRVRTLADELDIPVHIHLHETAGEVEQALARSGERPFAALDRVGLLASNLMAVHMTQLDETEVQRAAQTGLSVIHCPESNLKLASGLCPVARLDAAGVNVAIGTDGAASNNDLDMFGEMRTAALLAKGVSGDARAVPAARALRMATLNGAQALGLGHAIGSLEPGKWADMVAVDLSGPDCAPMHNPLSQLVYASGRHQVSDVWVAGRHLLNARALTTLDSDELEERAAGWQQRIRNQD